MNRKQQLVLIAGAFLLALMLLFPPWVRTFGYQTTRSKVAIGYFPLYSPPKPEQAGPAHGVEVDLARWSMQLLVTAFLMGVAIAQLKKSGTIRDDASRLSFSRRNEPPPNPIEMAGGIYRVALSDGKIYLGHIQEANLTYDDEPLHWANILRIDQSKPCACGDPSCNDPHGSGTIYLSDGTELSIRNWRERNGFFASATVSNLTGEFEVYCKGLGRTLKIDIFEVVRLEPADKA